jgi:hypothetical protein
MPLVFNFQLVSSRLCTKMEKIELLVLINFCEDDAVLPGCLVGQFAKKPFFLPK